jgi:hypothetical protein
LQRTAAIIAAVTACLVFICIDGCHVTDIVSRCGHPGNLQNFRAIHPENDDVLSGALRASALCSALPPLSLLSLPALSSSAQVDVMSADAVTLENHKISGRYTPKMTTYSAARCVQALFAALCYRRLHRFHLHRLMSLKCP